MLLWSLVIKKRSSMAKSKLNKLLDKHQSLTHSEMMSVISHVQRADGDWILNTIMVEGQSVPFKFRRKKAYKNLKGAKVNLTYYPIVEEVAGVEFEVMKVVRIKVA